MDEITGMNVVLNNQMFPFDYTCIRPVELIICKFMEVPCPRRIGAQYSIAYTIEALLKDSIDGVFILKVQSILHDFDS